jgi:hypothetical protein
LFLVDTSKTHLLDKVLLTILHDLELVKEVELVIATLQVDILWTSINPLSRCFDVSLQNVVPYNLY